MGIRFDIVIAGYILIFPSFVLFLTDVLGLRKPIINTIFFYWISILFTISFLISSIDIPFFSQFYDRLTIVAFEWMENFGFVFSMIIQEPRYFIFVLPFIILVLIFILLLKKMFNANNNEQASTNIYMNSIVSLALLSVMFLGIRGRIQHKSPIRVGTSYFSDNSFLNKLGLNPVFTLINSYLDDLKNSSIIDLMDNETAIQYVQTIMNISSLQYTSPLARKIVPAEVSENKPNVILVIMESMSAAKMKRHGNEHNLTPFLDSLANNSIYFENVYTSGKHTYNGIFSTLFSCPALYCKHPMKQIVEYEGISNALLKNGYSTTYFTTHDSQFDNVEGFLRANGFQNIISESNYPTEEVKTTLGVPDDYMFRYSIQVINDLASKNKPFFVTFMTASDHGPYYIPDYFDPQSEEIKQQVVEYADWSLKIFLTLSEKQDWFDNTIFVFIADHGASINGVYSIPLNYFHTPLILYAPKILQKCEVHNEIGSQLDVFPTVMGLLQQPYINNTFGIDLLNEKRKYAIVNDDDKMGILDTTYFCILNRNSESVKLLKYKDRDLTNYIDQDRDRANDMEMYAKSVLQTYQEILFNKDSMLRSIHDKEYDFY